MDFNLTAEQRLLREGAERYVRERHSFLDYRKLVTGNSAPPYAHWPAFAEMGWLALPISEDYGGMGCSFVEISIVMEELGRGLMLEPYITNVVLCGHILERGAPADMRERLLPRLAEGNLLLSLAHTEPGARYDLEQPGTTKAVRSGAGFTLNGSKTMALAATGAEMLIVSAKTDQGMALFLVDAKAPGVSLHGYEMLDRSGGADIAFKEVKLDAGALIAIGQPAADVLDEALDRATLAAVAQMLGLMEASVAVTTEHVKNRIAFGAPLGKNQAVQHMMAESFIELQESRSILYRGLAHIEGGDAVARRSAVSSAKAYVGQAAKQVCATGMQLHGGYGVTDEYQVGHCYRKVVFLEKLFGDSMFHSERVAAEFLPAA